MGELKKSRRNRRALHGDFCLIEANVLANYAFAFASRLRFLPAACSQGVKNMAALCRKGVGVEKEAEWLTP